MSHIPPEINDLMWQIAESQDDKAIEQFHERYPAYRAELMSRMTMVRGIKGSRPVEIKSKSRFLPTPQRLNSEPPRWVAFAAATFLLAAGVFATLGTLKFVESKNSPPPVVEGGLKNMSAQSQTSGSTGSQQNQSISPDETKPDIGEEAPVKPITAMEKRVTIVAKNISLDSALNDIAVQAGIRLESAPGMPDIIIQLDFRDIPAFEVLQALGRSFGFTPMIQTPNSALLIPARDPNSASGGQLPGSAGESPGNEHAGTGLLPVPGGTDNNENSRIGRETNGTLSNEG
ncbi:MAG: hypothetical protein KF824_00450 [Fimbriimonadaceae bacterium]|nr:MAG: hypothetical protein KF824_00450 [Fimbriimonadaceae bacterium]